MSAIQKVGIVGLGKMGAPMARHLAAKGFSVAGCDPAEQARSTVKQPGILLLARLSLPLCGTIKETIRGLKIRMGLGLPKGTEAGSAQ